MTAVGGTCRSPAFRASEPVHCKTSRMGRSRGGPRARSVVCRQRHWRQSPRLRDAAPPAARTSAQVLADGSDILGDSLICRTLQTRESLRGVFMVFRLEPVAGPGVRERD